MTVIFGPLVHIVGADNCQKNIPVQRLLTVKSTSMYNALWVAVSEELNPFVCHIE